MHRQGVACSAAKAGLAAVVAELGRRFVEVLARIQSLAHPLVVGFVLPGGVFVCLGAAFCTAFGKPLIVANRITLSAANRITLSVANRVTLGVALGIALFARFV